MPHGVTLPQGRRLDRGHLRAFIPGAKLNISGRAAPRDAPLIEGPPHEKRPRMPKGVALPHRMRLRCGLHPLQGHNFSCGPVFFFFSPKVVILKAKRRLEYF